MTRVGRLLANSQPEVDNAEMEVVEDIEAPAIIGQAGSEVPVDSSGGGRHIGRLVLHLPLLRAIPT